MISLPPPPPDARAQRDGPRRRGAVRDVLVPFLAGAGLLFLAACDQGGDQAQGNAQQQPQQPVPVGVVEVRLEAVTLGETFVGRIEAIQRVELRARVTGFLEERLFREGETVEQGTPLFRIEPEIYEAVVEQRRADLARAEAEQENAIVQLRRAQELVQRNNIPEATVDERQAAARTAEAGVLQARAALRQAEIDLGYTEIRSPIAGRIGQALFDVGDLVNPESGALAELVTQDPVYVLFQVSQRTLLDAQQAAGAQGLNPDSFVVRVLLPDGSEYRYQGKVNFVGITVSQQTDTVPVRAELPNPEGLLRDGQFVRVLIQPAEPEQAITIPQAAIQADQQGNFVLGVDGENKVRIQRVETGETLDQGRVVVRSGLQQGDRVIIQGIQQVRPGAPVDPSPIDPDEGA
ncbi:efflux RND transporter periplasmic adaptor subunit [Skermanella mucosa]|uniref:efflux RND transporter periplasmic adaptor subunit n=1 Tax=Skermanella mucosa TaxID=1789672 RepID=UPI00192BAD4F|nr:efflux RND transporter periplasmic adaptor subunit [Skermanella mucosa]UEM22134.1 efflux RND transporter periplasmic adaptor subunit [Skermanella mucosa]